jgi:hypothetical protein
MSNHSAWGVRASYGVDIVGKVQLALTSALFAAKCEAVVCSAIDDRALVSASKTI